MNKLICVILIVAFLTVTMPPCAYGFGYGSLQSCKSFHFLLSVYTFCLFVLFYCKKWPIESKYVMSLMVPNLLYTHTFIINYMKLHTA